MAIEKQTRLKYVEVSFKDDGPYAGGFIYVDEGAWDTDAKAWVGQPIAREQPISNLKPEERDRLDKVMGTITVKSIEAANNWKRELKAACEEKRMLETELVVATEMAAMRFQAPPAKTLWERIKAVFTG